MKTPIFICYRRDDTAGRAGWLRDAIANVFSSNIAFLDHSSIPPGSIWTEELRRKLQDAELVLVVIGPDWLTCSDKFGRRRLDQDEDWVRTEIETTLSEKKVLLPVLVGRAKLPVKEALPDSLVPLLDYQSLELRDEYWEHDLQLVFAFIKNKLHPAGKKGMTRGPYPIPPEDKPDPISEKQLKTALAGSLKNWRVLESPLPENPKVNRVELFREFTFCSFRNAVGFMHQLAPGCDIAIHHPRWENIFRTVRVYLTTWDIGHRISDRDVQLAKFFEQSYVDLTK